MHLGKTFQFLHGRAHACVGIADVFFSDLCALARTIILDIEGTLTGR